MYICILFHFIFFFVFVLEFIYMGFLVCITANENVNNNVGTII